METIQKTMTTRRSIGSDYIAFAKTRTQALFNLSTSGVKSYSLAELMHAVDGRLRLEDLELSGSSFYGYEPLQNALAERCGVATENVVSATGTSMANHLAMAAILDPGDEVLIEQPAYEPLVNAALYLGATVKRFPRPFEGGFKIHPRDIESAMTPHTRLVVLTNLHNPSGALTDEETLRQIGEIARQNRAHVLVDEVYLEMDFSRRARSAFHLGPNFIITSSLTKAYGLSGLRCGWALAEPQLAKRMWRLNDLFGVMAAHPAERLSVIVIEHLDKIAARAQALLETNRALLERFFDSRQDLAIAKPPFGTIFFPRLLRGSVDKLWSVLHEKFEATVVPGRFFETPDHFRLGIGGDTANLEEGLKRLGAAIDEL